MGSLEVLIDGGRLANTPRVYPNVEEEVMGTY